MLLREAIFNRTTHPTLASAVVAMFAAFDARPCFAAITPAGAVPQPACDGTAPVAVWQSYGAVFRTVAAIAHIIASHDPDGGAVGVCMAAGPLWYQVCVFARVPVCLCISCVGCRVRWMPCTCRRIQLASVWSPYFSGRGLLVLLASTPFQWLLMHAVTVYSSCDLLSLSLFCFALTGGAGCRGAVTTVCWPACRLATR